MGVALAAFLALLTATAALAAPPSPQQAPVRVPLDLCATSGPQAWQRVGMLPTMAFSATTLGGSAALGRVYVGTRSANVANTMYSGQLNEPAWTQVTDLRGIKINDILAPPDGSGAWVSGYTDLPPAGDANVYGAGAASPLAFTARGRLKWVSRMLATGGAVLAASTEPTTKGVHRWDAAQSQWLPLGGGAISTRAFRAFEESPGRMWLGTDGLGPWTSADGGGTWTPIEGGQAIQAATVMAIAIDPRDPDRIAIGLGPRIDRSTDPGHRGVRISVDGGRSWAPPVLEHVDYISALLFSQTVPNRLIAAAFGFGLLLSDDGGRTWQTLASPVDVGNRHFYRFFDLLTIVPTGRSGCELLFAGGPNGVWARNIAGAGPLDRRLYFPVAWTLRPATAMAADRVGKGAGRSGADRGRGGGADGAGGGAVDRPTATPEAITLSWPDGSE